MCGCLDGRFDAAARIDPVEKAAVHAINGKCLSNQVTRIVGGCRGERQYSE